MLAWGACGLLGGARRAAPAPPRSARADVLRARLRVRRRDGRVGVAQLLPAHVAGLHRASTCAGSGSTPRTRSGTSCSRSLRGPSCGACWSATRGGCKAEVVWALKARSLRRRGRGRRDPDRLPPRAPDSERCLRRARRCARPVADGLGGTRAAGRGGRHRQRARLPRRPRGRPDGGDRRRARRARRERARPEAGAPPREDPRGATAGRADRPERQLDDLGDPRPQAGTAARAAAGDPVRPAPPGPQRRLGLVRQRPTRLERHRGGDPGSAFGGSDRRAGPARPRLPAPPTEPRRRLRAHAGTRLRLPVHRVGDPGLPRPRAGRSRAARLPTCAACAAATAASATRGAT